jgi:hypothetical protein
LGDTVSANAPLDPFVVTGIVSLSVGGGLLVGGSIAGGLAANAWSDASTRCPNPQCSDSVGVAHADDAAVFGDVSTGLIASGAILAVTGAVFLIVNGLADEDIGDAWVQPTTVRF